MRHRLPPRVDVVKCENKEAVLHAFIDATLQAMRSADGDADAALAIVLLARSPASPVARAVGQHLAGRRYGSIGVRAIFLSLEPLRAAGSIAGTETEILRHDIRLARDSRLADAHEQLVLGSTASWVGDTMRRDPAKRDAFECFAADCPVTAGWARTSFERLWQLAEPVASSRLLLAGSVEAALLTPEDVDPSLTAHGPLDAASAQPGLTRN